MNKQQGGFTLIELIMVIVILGILAAFALPRFANLGSDARAATIKGVAGSMKSASAIAHSAYLATGSAATQTVIMEGATIKLDFGYPNAYGDGIIAAAGISDTDFTVSHENGVTTVKATGAANPDNCKVTYTKATAVDKPPVVAITVSPDNC
jgi:MSHA pilin protein MshA